MVGGGEGAAGPGPFFKYVLDFCLINVVFLFIFIFCYGIVGKNMFYLIFNSKFRRVGARALEKFPDTN